MKGKAPIVTLPIKSAVQYLAILQPLIDKLNGQINRSIKYGREMSDSNLERTEILKRYQALHDEILEQVQKGGGNEKVEG